MREDNPQKLVKTCAVSKCESIDLQKSSNSIMEYDDIPRYYHGNHDTCMILLSIMDGI